LNPDQLQVVNPGVLPIGVSPQNILHTTVRRNDNLARILHDMKLMEREGSGFDKMYEVLLSQGRPVPILREGPDRVEVTVRRRIISSRAIDVMTKVGNAYQLRQRETIRLGLLAQHEALTARELMQEIELSDVETLHSWMGRFHDLQPRLRGSIRPSAPKRCRLSLIGVRLTSSAAARSASIRAHSDEFLR
jgi:ATP-dependent DNA helicase RecG